MIDPADHVTQSLPMPAPLTLRVDTPARSIQAELVQDLVGCWMVIQSWIGKNGSRNGRKVTLVDSHEAGLTFLRSLVERHQDAAETSC